MGKHFGELAFIRGIIYYSLSPHEMKPYAGAFKDGIPNFITRGLNRCWTWFPPFALGYLTYTGVESSYKARQRKNPDDYINEVDPNA
ncbi:unnamed protein product [Leptosia nina]|uniref:Cytochrome b-c1 complex subunit 8 n=1 Tax=Leptosia nina TaxID=320188 RepID=A0AAV1JQH8_9NEOP